MNPYQKHPGYSRSAYRKSMVGISLVETMVGLTLGLIVTLVITQVWGVFEGQRSRTASGSTAQENGLMALTQLEQTIRNGGSGINAGLYQCGQIFHTYNDGGTTVSPVEIPSTAPAPVEITDGGAIGSDTIKIIMSKDIAGAIESSVTKQDPQQNAVINLNNVQHFSEVPNPCSATDKLEHLAVCRHGNQCVVMQVTSILEAALKLNTNKGTCAPYNPEATCYHAGGACAAWPLITTNDTCFAIGSFVVNTYSVVNDQLQVVTSGLTSGGPTTTILADNIVSLQAQYGVAQTGSQNADCWTNATAAGNSAVSNCGISWVAGALTGAQISRIKAVRLVVIARSPKPEGTDVTSTCVNNAGTNNGPCAWQDSATNKAPLINLSGRADWQRYRYRSYQTIIPLRNVIWAGV